MFAAESKQELVIETEKQGASLTFVGHSLGGGEAAYCALSTNKPAMSKVFGLSAALNETMSRRKTIKLVLNLREQ